MAGTKGRSGRKRKPSLLHQLHGNPGKRPLPKLEPKPTGKLAEPPPWLTESMQEGWRYAIASAPPGLLRLIDRGALLVWVVAENLHRQAVQKQSLLELVVRAPVSGQPIQSPYLPIINRQALIMLRAAAELGFSPASRPRAQAQPGGLSAYDDRQGDSLDLDPDGPGETLEEYLARDPSRRRQ